MNTTLAPYVEAIEGYRAMLTSGMLDSESYAEAVDALVNAVSAQHGSKLAAELVGLTVLVRNGNVNGL